MGFWGFKPFQNDYSLDDFGGFHSTEDMRKMLMHGIKEESNKYFSAHEVVGLLLETFGVTDNLFNGLDYLIVMDSIRRGLPIKAMQSVLSGESGPMVLSASTLSIYERKKLLIDATKKMRVWITKNIKGANISEETGLWVNVLDNEEYEAYRETYNLAVTFIKDGNKKASIDKSITIAEHIVAKLKLFTEANNVNDNIAPIVQCIKRIHNGNKIESYVLKNEAGFVVEVSPKDLKHYIGTKLINCINLQLTSDGRLLQK